MSFLILCEIVLRLIWCTVEEGWSSSQILVIRVIFGLQTWRALMLFLVHFDLLEELRESTLVRFVHMVDRLLIVGLVLLASIQGDVLTCRLSDIKMFCRDSLWQTVNWLPHFCEVRTNSIRVLASKIIVVAILIRITTFLGHRQIRYSQLLLILSSHPLLSCLSMMSTMLKSFSSSDLHLTTLILLLHGTHQCNVMVPAIIHCDYLNSMIVLLIVYLLGLSLQRERKCRRLLLRRRRLVLLTTFANYNLRSLLRIALSGICCFNRFQM